MAKLEAEVVEILKHRNGTLRLEKELRLALRHLTVRQLQTTCVIALKEMQAQADDELLFGLRKS